MEQVETMGQSRGGMVMETVAVDPEGHPEVVEAEVEVTQAGRRIGHSRTPEGLWGRSWAK